jgi:WD40 repeat protein
MVKNKGGKGPKIEKTFPVEETIGIRLKKIMYSNESSMLEMKQFPNKTTFGALRADGILVILDNLKNLEILIKHPKSEKIHSFCPLPKNQLLTASTTSVVLWDYQFQIVNTLEVPSSCVIYNEIKEYIFVLYCENIIKTTFYELCGIEFKFKYFNETNVSVERDASFKKIHHHVIGWNTLSELQILDVDHNCLIFEKKINDDDYYYGLYLEIDSIWKNQKNELFSRMGDQIYKFDDNYSSMKPMLKSQDFINCSSNVDGYFVTGCGGTVKFWTCENKNWKIAKTIHAHEFPLTEILFISDYKFTTSSLDGTVKEWLFVNQFTIIFVHFTEYEKVLSKKGDISFQFL